MDMKMFSTLRMKMTSEQDCQYGRKIKVLLDRMKLINLEATKSPNTRWGFLLYPNVELVLSEDWIRNLLINVFCSRDNFNISD
jgi:hypothetical protein